MGRDKKLLIVSIPYCELFFDQDGIYIKSIDDNDAEFRDEYFSRLFDYFGIVVERLNLSKELNHKIDVGVNSGVDYSEFIQQIKEEIKNKK
jgi:hypothetical protein